MTRKEFLSLLGMGTASVFLPMCMGGCSKDSATPAPAADFTLDLTSSAYSLLKTKGNFVTVNGVVIAYGTDDKYYAVQANCPHENGAITYNKNSNNFPCEKHTNNIFSNQGVSNGRETNSNLKTYTCTLSADGNTLTVKG